MPATPEAEARTRAFARILGPFLVIVPGIVVIRAPSMGPIFEAFFRNQALVWITGGFLVFGGLLIIANHQFWSSASAVVISLFGWFLLLRGLILLIAPNTIAEAGAAALDMLPVVRIGFGALSLAGLWLTYVGWIARPRSPS